MVAENIPGYSGFLWLYDEAVATAAHGETFVEVGLGIGHSLSYLASKVIAAKKNIVVYGVDPFNGDGRNGEQQAMLGEKKDGDCVTFLDLMMANARTELDMVRLLRAPSVVASRMFGDESVGLVLIDGSHQEADVFDDIGAWWPKVKRGGILAGDDHCAPHDGVEAACRRHDAIRGYGVRGNTWYKVKS